MNIEAPAMRWQVPAYPRKTVLPCHSKNAGFGWSASRRGRQIGKRTESDLWPALGTHLIPL